MLNEIKILFNNVRDFRKHLLSEGVSENRIADAINNHEIIYIYYSGDETVMKGWRTIRPFVLGKYQRGPDNPSNGETVLRAWQDAGSSDSYKKQHGVKPRMGHEKHVGPHGQKPGWRLFKVNGITSLLPTGKGYDPKEYFNVGGVVYNPNDKEMSGIIASIKTGGSDFDKQRQGFQDFHQIAKKAGDITKDEVEGLLRMARQHRKEAYRKFDVVQLANGDYALKTKPAVIREKIPQDAIVGNLKDLYNKFIVPQNSPDKAFFRDQKQKAERDAEKN